MVASRGENSMSVSSPPYESGAALYIRPLLIGTGAQVGVRPADEYLFIIFVTPVGPYFKGGFAATNYVITREFDRAAPHGTGRFKVGGNYAASLRANKWAHDNGYSCEFYLDAKEKKYIDECGAANFFGIKDNTYITPASSSILPSITNKSLQQIAKDLGLKVEVRPILEEELPPSKKPAPAARQLSSAQLAASTTPTTAPAINSHKTDSPAPYLSNSTPVCATFNTASNPIPMVG